MPEAIPSRPHIRMAVRDSRFCRAPVRSRRIAGSTPHQLWPVTTLSWETPRSTPLQASQTATGTPVPRGASAGESGECGQELPMERWTHAWDACSGTQSAQSGRLQAPRAVPALDVSQNNIETGHVPVWDSAGRNSIPYPLPITILDRSACFGNIQAGRCFLFGTEIEPVNHVVLGDLAAPSIPGTNTVQGQPLPQ